jgi:hypothetical protein
LLRTAIAAVLLLAAARAQLLQPFSLDHRAASASPADLSFLLDAPAGKDGFIQIRNGHLAKGSGERIRFWGVHFTDWSPGSVEIVPKQDAAFWAATLARFGINLVRLHFLDLNAPRGLIDASSPNSLAFDPAQLDRLDYEVAQLKQHGIYVDLNLNVGRSYKAGDGVRGFDKIRWAKGLTLFDPRLIELEKDYARRLLTHVNPYTHTAYRDEPAVALVEIVNENGLYPGFRAPTPYYGEELTALFNAWLARTPTHSLAAPTEHFRLETLFYMDAENRFYQDMSAFLKHTLGVRCPIIGTADHAHSSSPYPMLASLSKLDVLDGHVYWEHPGAPPPHNTPMVDDPLHSTVVQLSRTTFSGKPYTVSEFNHPFPNDYLAEGIPILAAYASFQDWDAVVAYTFEPKRDPAWKPYIGDPFDISLDPVRMTQMATGALLFLRSDVHPSRQTIERTYSPEQVIDSRRLPRSEQPYFTPGFPLALPLEHAVRIRSLDGPPTGAFPPAPSNPIVSDTGELTWSAAAPHTGLVTIETPRTEAVIGFLPGRDPLAHLGVDVKNNFAAIVLSSLDATPLAQSTKMLLTAAARVANTGMQWNDSHTRLATQGGPPTLIEPVAGTLTLRGLTAARKVLVSALDGAGRPMRQTTARRTGIGWNFPVGDPATTWYVISVERK